jgi:hypothetical protein
VARSRQLLIHPTYPHLPSEIRMLPLTGAPPFGVSPSHAAKWRRELKRWSDSSGGKERLLGISERGDAYMRRVFINGARALVRIPSGRTGGIWDWVNALLSRRAFNVCIRRGPRRMLTLHLLVREIVPALPDERNAGE